MSGPMKTSTCTAYLLSLRARSETRPEQQSGSIPERLVDDVAKRKPAGEPMGVLDDELGAKFGPMIRLTGDVRRQDHILHSPERVTRREWLRRHDVQPGSSQAARLECPDQRIRIDQLPACDVHEVHTGLHQSELPIAEEPERLLGQGGG